MINNVDTDYRVYWDAGTVTSAFPGTYTLLSASTGGENSFVMTSGFSSGTTYYFKIQAFNEFGSSPLSNPIMVITASVPV